MLLGLTGLYCAGKNYIASRLEKQGFTILDVDKLGWTALNEAKFDLTARWGSGILGSDGVVDRKMLGKIVFNKPEELAALENIVHPLVNHWTDCWIRENHDKNMIINAALLHKSSSFSHLDSIILVRASLLTRMIRAKVRDKLTLFEIARRFSTQKKFNSQYLERNADIYIINNEGFGNFSRIFQRNLEKRLSNIPIFKNKPDIWEKK
ncbi:MAG: dephospho-CoA kinase [Spirochaetaceae bacterium]|jgi:dephospho-CoA kinase|nr:dephospho-CoA kinase [Spirochaetaceae bacterium]